MKFQTHCVATLAALAFTGVFAGAQNPPPQSLPPQRTVQGHPVPSPSVQVPKPPAQRSEQRVKDASGKMITVDHGGNLAIGPNDKVEFNNQVLGGSSAAPIMILQSGWIYLYEGGFVYKIRQSDMKLIAKTEIGPEVAVEPPPVPVKRTSKRKSTRKRH